MTFSAIYYGEPDAGASSRLSAMAAAGAGKFLDTNINGATFDISDVVTIPGVTCAP